MSIFAKFNNQGLGDPDAFEELCCQLFETWGLYHEHYSNNNGWAFRNIRGTGGDGGIEAYWHNMLNGDWIGLQAKWFQRTINSTQYSELSRSIKSAMDVRPTMGRYIVCIPHNLTSAMKMSGQKNAEGEDVRWKKFIETTKNKYPCLQIELWDENEIFNQLQKPENEGRRRYWFEHSLINPETIELSLDKTIETIRGRYIPKLTEDGGISDFLDDFFGTQTTKLTLVNRVDYCNTLCKEIIAEIDSLISVDDKTVVDLKDRALACTESLRDYSRWLAGIKRLLAFEPSYFPDVKPFEVNYAVIEHFASKVHETKRSYRLPEHLGELDDLFDKFRDAPSPWEIAHDAQRSLSWTHCIIKGDQGTGKTCGLASKSRDYQRNQQHLPILVLATSVKDHDAWWKVIADTIGLGSDWDEAALWQALSSAAAIHDVNDIDFSLKSKVAILVDGLDERPPSSLWERMIKEGDAISHRYPRIRFAYSIRSGSINFKDPSITACSYQLGTGGDVPACKLFDRYINYYEIDLDGNEQFKWLLKTPMELHLFCMIHKGRKIAGDTSAYLTDLVKNEIKRLDDEFASRNHRKDGEGACPVQRTLLALAQTFLGSNCGKLSEDSLQDVLKKIGLDKQASVQMIELLLNYGILSIRRTKGRGSFDPCDISYSVGSRHLWDYFMAILMLEDDFATNKELLSGQPDAAQMFSILLVENKKTLPLSCKSLVEAVGDRKAYELTLFALSNARPESVAPFRGWVLDQMRSGKDTFSKIVNGLVVQVANIEKHPLGPLLLDEFLRTFDKPAERDAEWSLPSSLYMRGINYQTAAYHEREVLKHLPHLHKHETSTQMPLVLAWGLSSLNNLKRRHCRSELVMWGLSNPTEFSTLFSRFCSIDDPQIREDIFAIAEEVCCQGTTDTAIEAEIGRIVLDSLFSKPDNPGNRDAALRFYGRNIVERCFLDGLLSESEASRCRPPYAIHSADVLQIFPDASKATAMSGYWPISDDLARYVLSDRLADVFNIHHVDLYKQDDRTAAGRVIIESASAAGIEPPAFDGWVIAAAYQYLLDHGYDPAVFDADASNGEQRLMGPDRLIRRCFYAADHGEQSTVMTVAEKYVWCALREICGYMADRVPVQGRSQCGGQPGGVDSDGLVTDYSKLISFDSPLLETTVLRLRESRKGQKPRFPTPFSCEGLTTPLTKNELQRWIGSVCVDAATVLLDFRPNTDLSITGEVIPVALYANDWGVCGKESCVWLYAGIIADEEADKLENVSCACLDGYSRASEFQVGFSTPACYLSPVEVLSSPWMEEYDEPSGAEVVADAHINAKPLSGECAARLIGMGDYFYDFPSKLARDFCDISRTDGCRYYDSEGNVRFEYVEFGTPYRHEYKALLADKNTLMNKASNDGKSLLWYATVQREATNLAMERIPGLADRIERSWIIWCSCVGKYASCPVFERDD